MNALMNMLLNEQNGSAVQQLAKNFGISSDDALKAVSQLAPKLGRSAQQNMASPDGLSGMLAALQGGQHQRYLDEPATLASPETVQDGNNILGHLLGSKDASRLLANEAASSTGLDGDMLKKMLPMVAAMVMGGMSKQSNAMGAVGQASSTNDLGSMLTTFLDADKDGSVIDDLMGMAHKLF